MAPSRKSTWLVLLAALCLLANPAAKLARAEAEEGDDYEGSEGEEGEEEDADVVVITADNFEETVIKAKYALVEFYAPWCGHCKTLKPEYAAAATELKEYDASIIIGKVDATEEAELAQKFGVEGYPTLKWFVNGEAKEFGGGRDADAIVSWVKKKTGPPSKAAKTIDEVKALQEEDGLVGVAYFAKFEGPAFDAFIAMAENEEKVTFVHTNVAAVASEYGVKSAPGLVLLKDFDDGNAVYSGKFEQEALATFINGEKNPLIIPFSEDNAESIFGSGIKIQLILFGDSEVMDEAEPLWKDYVSVAKQMRGKVVFVTVGTETEAGRGVMEFFSVADADGATLFAFDISNEESGVKFKFSGDLKAASIQKFAESVLAGKETPYYKSAAPPAKNDGPVTVVVGTTFDSIALAKDKDVLLEVYAPWCGHCKKLAPIWTKLGKRFQAVDSVVIAKMDGTANEHKDLKVEGFPTVTFYPAKGGEAVDCGEGCSRTLSGLTKFIKEHAAIDYELPKKGGKDEL